MAVYGLSMPIPFQHHWGNHQHSPGVLRRCLNMLQSHSWRLWGLRSPLETQSLLSVLVWQFSGMIQEVRLITLHPSSKCYKRWWSNHFLFTSVRIIPASAMVSEGRSAWSGWSCRASSSRPASRSTLATSRLGPLFAMYFNILQLSPPKKRCKQTCILHQYTVSCKYSVYIYIYVCM